MRRILNVHFVIILMGIGALAMFIPFLHGVAVRDWQAARGFFYSGLLFSVLTLLLAIASYNTQARNLSRSHLLALLFGFAGLPVILAVPLYEAVGNTTFLNAYFEMVSSFTTTGASLLDAPGRVSSTVHLWRALVGWLGGYFVWVTAIAILAPMNLGGFEVTASSFGGSTTFEQFAGRDPRERLLRFGVHLLPIYTGLTGLLWLGLVLAGEIPFVAICHAMSTMATSGISPVGGVDGGTGGFAVEALIFLFFGFAISRQSFTVDFQTETARRLRNDPEIALGVACVVLIPVLLFVRHWLGAYDIDEQQNFFAAIRALWGSIFTVLSYLSTTGFVSADWAQARDWSGLQTPGLILMGLALIGGGVATTAGGVKLLRVYALYKHGIREMDKLIHPSSVGGSGAFARHIRRQGAYIAWVFFMLFALSLALIIAALSLTGLGFESSTVLSIAALSTTGPLAAVGGEAAISYADLGEVAKMILAAAMILGRLETLAIIALLNPEFWRK